MNMNDALRLYAITDRGYLPKREGCMEHDDETQALLSQVRNALEGGVTMIQYREKDKNYPFREEQARELLTLCHAFHVPLIINDDVELAMKTGADGVHVGQSDTSVAEAKKLLGQGKIVGATAKTVDQAKAAALAGADYLGSGAVFGSGTKKDAKKMDLGTFKEICNSVEIPVVAIGGITLSNVSELEGCSMAGVAVIGGLFGTKDVKTQAEKFIQKLRELT